MDKEIINNIKSLGIDMINEAKSGHPGIVLSAAPIIYTLYANHLNINTSDRNWYNRDRFVMSSGHGSALLYATLFMSGYNLSLDDLKKFRKLNSKTPGHPELDVTPGVECSTGPLGQGIATAVGIALGGKILQNQFKLPSGQSLFDFKTYVLVGDGDLMEGISYESCSLAGTYNLNNLIILYDSNNMSLDGSTNLTFKEDVIKRFKSMGFKTYKVKNGNDIKKLNFVLNLAKRANKPVFIEIKTKLGDGSLLENTNQVHGKPLSKEDIEQLKVKLKIPNEPFYVNEQAKSFMQNKIANRVNKKYTNNVNVYKEYVEKVLNGNRNRISYLFNRYTPCDITGYNWQLQKKQSLRDSNEYVLRTILDNIPMVIGGSADVGFSTKTYFADLGNIASNSLNGKNIWFGVREHAMGAILNGLALMNFRTFGSTFLAFSDYLKPAIRMSALMNLPVTYIFTHDSINIGSDGPTHQPVEQLASLRATPNLNVYRPADCKELIACWHMILNSKCPSALILSRNEVTLQSRTSAEGTLKGGYIFYPETEQLQGIIVATGTEVATVKNIVKEISNSIRVVSIPSKEVFALQSKEYRKNVLPPNIKTVVVEAGSKYSWGDIATDEDCFITIDTFGKSGTSDEVANYMNFSYEKIKERLIKIFNL
ncbi:MAG: transketolase [Bacilli bacterium]|nr:transketolase [Bacilli bacterium]